MPPIIFSRTNVENSLIALLSREIMIEQMIQWRVRHQAAGVFRYGDKTLFRSRILFFPRRERNSKFSFSECKISLKNCAWFANCTILHLIPKSLSQCQCEPFCPTKQILLFSEGKLPIYSYIITVSSKITKNINFI